MKKVTTLFSAALPFLILVLLGHFFFKRITATETLYQLKEPMLIATSLGEPFYMIPKNTVLRFKKSYAEGHQLYTIEVFFKGALPADMLPRQAPIESTWLYQIEPDDIPELHQKHPLSKDDLVRMMKAQKMTRGDLTRLPREWKID